MIARKFLFDTDFEAFDSPAKQPAEETPQLEEEVVEIEEELPPAPTFSEEDLANAHREGFQQGHQQGREEGFNEASNTQATQETQALSQIATSLGQLLTNAAQQQQKSEEVAVATALAVVGKLLPTYSRKHGFGEVEALIRNCLQNLQEEPRIVIRVEDDLLDPLQEKIHELTTNSAFEGKVVLLADDELAPSDVRIEWADGGMERDSQRLWQEINAIMNHVHSAADLPDESDFIAQQQATETPPADQTAVENGDQEAVDPEAAQPAIAAFEHLPEFQNKQGDAPLAPETPPSPQPTTFEEALSTADGPARTEPTGQPQQRS